MTCRFSPDAARAEFTSVRNSFITDALPSAGGVQLKVYLYGLMQCSHPAYAGSIADALGISPDEVTAAFCYWQTQGFVRIISDAPLTVEYLLPDAAEKTSAPGKYHELVTRLAALTAPRQFSLRELTHVYDWIEVYNLEEGAVLELVGYCMEKKGRRVSVNYMDAVAEGWAEDNVRTVSDARAAIERYALQSHGATAVLRQWNKRRKPTVDELSLYEKWTKEWGFSGEAILSALPRLTVSGSPNFTYLDELLSSLRAQDLKSAVQIEEDDEKSVQERAFAKLLFERAGKVEPATRTQRAQISLYLVEFQMPRELLFYAADLSRGANEPFGKMKLLLNAWHAQGISDVAAAQAFEAARLESRPAARQPRRPRNFEGRTVTDEQFRDNFLNLNEDL